MLRLASHFSLLNSRRALRRALPLLVVGGLLAGCTPNQTEPTPSTGSLDVTRYLAVGDGYTAGISDGGLTAASQEYAYPELLARQFRRINPDASFSTGLLPGGPGTGFLTLRELSPLGLPQTRRVTQGRALRGAAFINPTACGGPDTTFLYAQAPAGVLPQNLGVPGLGLGQVAIVGLGNTANQSRNSFNPYLERLLPANDNRSYLQVVNDASQSATFFTFFMGLGDALPYILSGGECNDLLPKSNTLNLNAKKILDQLTAGDRPGVIALTPDIRNLPLLRLGGVNGIRGRLAEGVNPDSIYVRSAPANVVRLIDPKDDYILPGGLARLGASEQVKLPDGRTITARYGLSKYNPLSRRDVLDYFEFNRVNAPLVNLNVELIRLADKVYNRPTVNLEGELFFQLNDRISVNGAEYSAAAVRGNFYSLDLYSLTPRGNALLANAFLKTINHYYGANIPLVDPNTLPTTAQPQ